MVKLKFTYLLFDFIYPQSRIISILFKWIYIKCNTKSNLKGYFSITFCSDLMCYKDIKGQKVMCESRIFKLKAIKSEQEVVGN